eukprot:Sro155_g070340.2  (110) ;mRNA; f:22667-22996
MFIPPVEDPDMISWKPLGLMSAITTILPLVFQDDRDMSMRLVENTMALKFTSHDLGIIEFGMKKFGLKHTLGHLYDLAVNTTSYPIQQATLDGAEAPVLVAKQAIEVPQ